MKHEVLNWKTADGIEIYAQSWMPDAQAKALVCIVHGMGEHSGRYAHVAKQMNQSGFAVTAYDHRGHGKSGGKRGHSPTFELLLDGVEDFITRSKKIFPGIPVFLFGHSMGGNAVLNFALRRNPSLQGVIASGPWIKLAFEPPAFKVMLAKVFAGLLPSLTQSTELDANNVSRDPKEVKAYVDDALVHDQISTAMFLGTYQAGLWALENAAQFKLPLLIEHGTADALTSAKASEEFASKVKGDVTLKLWNGLYHELHNEPEKVEVIDYVIKWMEKHL